MLFLFVCFFVVVCSCTEAQKQLLRHGEVEKGKRESHIRLQSLAEALALR